MSVLDTLKFWSNSDPYEELVTGLRMIQGDMDALALLPYDDGTFFLKPCNFDKDLIGGQGGYETDDGDKIVLDGDGEPKRDLFGVPLLLAVDPTEHAAAVDPIKALVAQKDNIGEWIRVDREANVVELGPALKSVADSAVFAEPGSEDHWTTQALEYDAVEDRLLSMGVEPDDASEELIQQAVRQVEQAAADAAENDEDREEDWRDYLPWGDDIDSGVEPAPEPVDIDIEDSMVGDKLREMGVQPNMASDEMVHKAMKHLAENDDLTKVYDIAPPAAPAVADGGELVLEEATHIAVDQSKAADLLPKTTSTTELNTALDKARMEEHDEDKVKDLITYGIIIGAVIGGVFAVVMAIIFALI